MATILNWGLLDILTLVFVGIFVFVILYGFFLKLKIFGEDSAPIGALVAAMIALIFILVADLRDLITFFVPWVAVVFVVAIIILLMVMLLGFTQKDITSYLTDNPAVTTAAVIVIIVVFIIAINQVFPNSLGYPSDSGGFLNDARRVIFNPKVLGVALVLVIISFVIKEIGFQK